jgi:hypothetical protein
MEGFEDIEAADSQQRHVRHEIFSPYGDRRTHDARDDDAVNKKRLHRRNVENSSTRPDSKSWRVQMKKEWIVPVS